MAELMEIYQAEREKLGRELEAAKDVKEAVDCLCIGLERVKTGYIQSLSGRRQRREADRMFDLAKQSVRSLQAASGADVKVLQDVRVTVTREDQIIALLPVAVMVVSAALAVWLLIKDMNFPAILCVVLAGLAWLEPQLLMKRRLAMSASVRVDRYELLRVLDRMMESMNASLDAGEEADKALPVERPQVTGDMLEPVQMLLEAVSTQDGAYALKAVPKLEAALMEQGIETVAYSVENRAYFDLFPGTEEGITIRPALVKDGQLIARGQATERMD